MKAWIVFEKKPRLRHVGHLDLMRSIQRALRRSGLPISFSKGFNPHLLLSFAAPLSVGAAGLHEIMEVPLSAGCTENQIFEALSKALPPELPCVSVRLVDDTHPAPMALLQSAEYEIRPLENADALLSAVPALRDKKEIPAIRKTKSGEKPCDIRPMIFNLLTREDGTIRALLALSEAATCKPDLLVEALSKEAGLAEKPRVMVTRVQMYGESFAPLETL